MSIRPVKRLIKSKPTVEGAGVHLRRAFGFGNTSDFDPFLLLDDFRNDIPDDFLAGFPWHPHRGIETIRRLHPPEAAIPFEDRAWSEEARLGEQRRIDAGHRRPRDHVFSPRQRTVAPVPLR